MRRNRAAAARTTSAGEVRAKPRLRLRQALALALWLTLGLALALPGSATADDFAPVLPGHQLSFPRDTGAHPDFRTEWWYITGWLSDEQGRERGFQVTFFRVGTGLGADNPSRFAPRQLMIAHAAIADPATGHLLHAERIERALHPLAGAALGETHAWIGDWSLRLHDGVYRTAIHADAFDLELNLTAPDPPLLNGRDGFSQKTPDPANASYYYSRPQLATIGTLRLADQAFAVSGRAWLDHEWSSELLSEAAQGWDWIGINLDDGGSLMAFRMRRPDGSTLWASATLRHGDQPPRQLAAEQLRFIAGRRWQSPRTGADYPVEWTLMLDGRQLALRALMDDQELDARGSTGVVYWEGATRLLEDGHEIGRGYLEMTGYWQRPAGL